MPKFDILWKAILESIFEHFLTFFYPESDDYFDFSKGFTFLDKELAQLFPAEGKPLEMKIVDKLVKVFTKDGDEQWVLVHIEVQSYSESNFNYRMFQYYSRIKDKYNKRITAFAILTDNTLKFHPKKFEEEFLGTRVLYEFNTYKVIEQSLDELQSNSNPFACVILAVKAAIEGKSKGDDFRFQFKKELYHQFRARSLVKNKERAILFFLDNYVSFENKAYEVKFEKEVKQVDVNTMNIDDLIREEIINKLKAETQAEKEKAQAEREKAQAEREKAQAEREKARKKELDVAIKLKAAGVDVKIIANSTGLSLDEIEKL